jgi:hypothetical protein
VGVRGGADPLDSITHPTSNGEVLQCVAPHVVQGTCDCVPPGWGNVSMKHVGEVALFADKLVPKMAPPEHTKKEAVWPIPKPSKTAPSAA